MSLVRIGAHAVSLAALAALGACATVPLPQPAPLTTTAWRHAVPAGPAPTDLHGWWREFHDPQLDALVDQALANNLNVAQALERLRAARALGLRANDRYLPQLHAHTVDAIDYSAGDPYRVGGFDAGWELGLFGRSEANRRVLQGEVDSAAAQLDQVRVSLVGEIVANWLTLGAAHEQVALQAQIHEQRQRQLDLLRTRASLGLAGATQLNDAEIALAHSASDVLEAQQGVDVAAQQLALLLGRAEPEALWLRTGEMPHLGDWSLAETPADLVRTRPDIVRAEAEVLRAAGESGLARSELLPSIGIGGTLVWAKNVGSNQSQHTTRIGSIGPIVDIPLFDWGLRLAQSQAKGFELQASVLAYREAVLEGVAETETALGNLQRQREHEVIEAAALDAAERSSTAIAKRVELELASPVDEQAAAIERDQARLELLHARAARGMAYVALFKALGGAPRPLTEAGSSAQHP